MGIKERDEQNLGSREMAGWTKWRQSGSGERVSSKGTEEEAGDTD